MPPVNWTDSSPSIQRGALCLFQSPVLYSEAWALQVRLHQARLSEKRPDTVMILEHQPVYTLGRKTRPGDWLGNEESLRAHGAELYHVNRGGSITFHGPGQIVVYPIIKVAEYASGPRQLVWLLEEVIIRLLSRWDVDGHRLSGKPGVWVSSPRLAKIASIGVRIERGISLHGFALNVDMDLSPFQLINPCGIAQCRMTALGNLGKTGLSINEIKRDLGETFGEVFGIEWATMVEIPSIDGREVAELFH